MRSDLRIVLAPLSAAVLVSAITLTILEGCSPAKSPTPPSTQSIVVHNGNSPQEFKYILVCMDDNVLHYAAPLPGGWIAIGGPVEHNRTYQSCVSKR